MRDLARRHTRSAIQTLALIMEHGKTEIARTRAAEALLERAWGKAVQPVTSEGVGPLEIVLRHAHD